MKEWLLKEEAKAKVGRPKLATYMLIKKSYIMLLSSLIIVLILSVCFIGTIKHMSPLELLNYTFGKKLEGIVSNNNGFIVKEYYDDGYDYVMKINASSYVKNYSGNYKYTTYYLKNNKWIEHDSKELKKGDNFIKIKFESLKNQNRTWKVKIQVLNSSGVKESYAPYGWKYVDAKKEENKYAYKIFTVKGYYSPVTLSEEKESSKNKDKISVSTEKKDPIKFNVSVKDYAYDMNVFYTDNSGKKTTVLKKDNLKEDYSFNISNDQSVIKVTINIYVKDIKDNDLKKMVLSNWEIKTDEKSKQDYVTNTYLLKPERGYKK